MYIFQSQNITTIWARAIASRSSLTTINSSCFISYLFSLPVVISTLICTSHVGSPLFQDIQPFVLDLPPSFQAEIGGGTWLVIWPDDSSNLSPAHTSTHRQTKWSYAYRLFIVLFFKSVMSYSAGQYSLLSDERASLCESSCRQSMRYIKKLRLVFW